jgi:hypothetical protein
VGGGPTGVTRRRRNIVVAIVLGIGLVVGVSLVVTGGDDTEPTTSTQAPTTAPSAPLPLDDLSSAGISEFTGLVVPPDATDFLTARLDSDRQLDLTFVTTAEGAAAFVEASGLPEPVADERIVLHSSPLWKLNPEDDVTLRSTQDTVDGVRRAVELLESADGSVRARVVITSAE